MAKVKIEGPLGPSPTGPQVSAVQMTAPESQARLQQHMSVLQGFGFTDLGTLGNLNIGLKGKTQVAVLQKSGVLLPAQSGPFLAQPEPLLGVARRGNNAGSFDNLTGTALVTASRTLTTVGGGNGTATSTGTNTGSVPTGIPVIHGKMAQDIPINLAYWFATEIVLQDDTTLVLAAGVTSLVIIAEKLTIGNRVTISWERPSDGNASTVPLKPQTPEGFPQAPSIIAQMIALPLKMGST